jgi:hypothetical protein
MAKTSTSYKPGEKKKVTRKGIPNKITKTVKEVVLAAFNELQLDPKANLVTWGKENPKEFYQVAAKLIPTEVNATVTKLGADLEDEIYNK